MIKIMGTYIIASSKRAYGSKLRIQDLSGKRPGLLYWLLTQKGPFISRGLMDLQVVPERFFIVRINTVPDGQGGI
jgi:hypothetical protein